MDGANNSLIIRFKIEKKLLKIFDFIILAIVTVISHVFAYSKKEVDKKEGFALTAMYIAYMVYIIIRN